MRRRALLKTAAAGALVGTVGVSASGSALAATGEIDSLAFDSTASQLNAAGEPLTDDSLVAVWAAETAFNVDEDGEGDAVDYPDDADIPLVSSDGGVVGFGAPFVQNGSSFGYGNEELVLNVLDAEANGSAVAFDDGHGQFYDSDSFSQFLNYAEDNGYEADATTDLAGALPDADAAIVTSPSTAFTDDELDALSTFVDDGGALLLFDQSDFGNFDATDNLNEIASALGIGFRFNDDQVIDEENNDGIGFVPTTDRFNTDAFDYFADRPGIAPPDLEKGEQYEVDVIDVADGDTVDIRFANGYVDTVRILGIDTPETGGTEETTQEWEGLSDEEYLKHRGDDASAFAWEKLGDETVSIRFDDEEPLRGGFGRLLAYIDVDADGDGTYEYPYNRAAVREGYARVYDSGFGQHDSFLKEEFAARDEMLRLWERSDPDASQTIRNGEVTQLYAPYATSVRTTDGRIDPKRVPVTASATATQQGAEVEYDGDVPLVGVDQHARVAMVGSSLIDEQFEDEEFPEDVSEYGNYAFLTSLLDRLSDREGDMLIDGGHGQFGGDRSVGAEDAANYLRYLEGVDLGFEQVNDLTGDLLDRGRAILISAPATSFTDAEITALREFIADGGGVVLLGGDVPTEHRENLDSVADGLATDLRLGRGRVVDEESNLADRASLPTTSNFDDWYRLFGGYDADTNYKGPRAGPGAPGESGKGPGKGNGNGKGNGKGHGD
jgi:endonuclease YncB( thermonuclease family)